MNSDFNCLIIFYQHIKRWRKLNPWWIRKLNPGRKKHSHTKIDVGESSGTSYMQEELCGMDCSADESDDGMASVNNSKVKDVQSPPYSFSSAEECFIVDGAVSGHTKVKKSFKYRYRSKSRRVNVGKNSLAINRDTYNQLTGESSFCCAVNRFTHNHRLHTHSDTMIYEVFQFYHKQGVALVTVRIKQVASDTLTGNNSHCDPCSYFSYESSFKPRSSSRRGP